MWLVPFTVWGSNVAALDGLWDRNKKDKEEDNCTVCVRSPLSAWAGGGVGQILMREKQQQTEKGLLEIHANSVK